MPKVERTVWTERAKRRECWAEEGTARAVRRDTREVGNVQEWVKMRMWRWWAKVGGGTETGGVETETCVRDRDGRCETEVSGEVWRGDCGGKLPTSSKEARNEEMVLAFFLVEGGVVVVIRAESGLDEMDSAKGL